MDDSIGRLEEPLATIGRTDFEVTTRECPFPPKKSKKFIGVEGLASSVIMAASVHDTQVFFFIIFF